MFASAAVMLDVSAVPLLTTYHPLRGGEVPDCIRCTPTTLALRWLSNLASTGQSGSHIVFKPHQSSRPQLLTGRMDKALLSRSTDSL